MYHLESNAYSEEVKQNAEAQCQYFTFIGNVAFTGTAGEVRFFLSGADIIIQVELDNDGNVSADMEIQLTGAGAVGINASDFIL